LGAEKEADVVVVVEAHKNQERGVNMELSI